MKLNLPISKKFSISLILFSLVTFHFEKKVFANGVQTSPLRVDADSLKHDDKNLVTTFKGNVVLIRDNLTIKGDILELKQTSEGLSYGHIIGNPAKFKQKRETDGDWIEGKAKRLDYDERKSMFFLYGNASLKRKSNGETKDEVSGDRLSYNSLTEIYKAETIPGETRTRMTLMPRKPNKD
ncbi:MAG: lipopolysaccharide transport periplasmic protein LptA [Betaproteobacteria bacterium TMED156]|nr:MAG: lipopolysaccharide transport periplasmic protein LptA [Betaproteobacteria bacterium TMED156]|tara:strand:- start:250 stop:792 length:543 start_codon:yes stop_codon:yes gene_type:complete